MTSRRRFLTAGAASLPASVGFAGCLSRLSRDERTTETPTDERNVEDPDPVSEEAFEAWEPDTDCTDGGQEPMHNSEISVQDVRDELDDGYNPIAYGDLPDEEKQILAEVLETGGYATCDVSEAFRSFMEKAVYEYAAEQDDADDMKVFLAYDGAYYRLYIRMQDQVYAY